MTKFSADDVPSFSQDKSNKVRTPEVNTTLSLYMSTDEKAATISISPSEEAKPKSMTDISATALLLSPRNKSTRSSVSSLSSIPNELAEWTAISTSESESESNSGTSEGDQRSESSEESKGSIISFISQSSQSNRNSGSSFSGGISETSETSEASECSEDNGGSEASGCNYRSLISESSRGSRNSGSSFSGGSSEGSEGSEGIESCFGTISPISGSSSPRSTVIVKCEEAPPIRLPANNLSYALSFRTCSYDGHTASSFSAPSQFSTEDRKSVV